MIAGLIGDALRSRGYRNGRLFVIIGSALLAFLPAVGTPLIGDPRAALAMMPLSMFFITVLLTSAAPAVQELRPNRMQGTFIALYALVTNFIGLGLGPTAVALITDHVLRDERHIGVSLACLSCLSIGLAVVTGWSALPCRQSLAAGTIGTLLAGLNETMILRILPDRVFLTAPVEMLADMNVY